MNPFRIDVPDAELDDLRARLQNARWPEHEPVADWSQRVPLHWLDELCRYWADGYDWRTTERRLNDLPQFRTEIDGLAIHFIHVRSSHERAVPLILTHGWPGSFLEFEQALAPLAETFHVVLPSLPGYAFSDRPATTGWGIHRIAHAWVELMTRLGYRRFIAAGSDWGDQRLDEHRAAASAPLVRSSSRTATGRPRSGRRRSDRRRTGRPARPRRAVPERVGILGDARYAPADDRLRIAGLADRAGRLDREKLVTWTDQATGGLSRDQILDNLSLYWFTRTATPASRARRRR